MLSEKRKEQKAKWQRDNAERVAANLRAWRAKNKEKVRQYNLARAEYHREWRAQWRATNPELARKREREKYARWVAKDPENARKCWRGQYARRQRRKKNAEKRKENSIARAKAFQQRFALPVFPIAERPLGG